MNLIVNHRPLLVAFSWLLVAVPTRLVANDCEAQSGTILAHVGTVCFVGDTVNLGGSWLEPVVPPGFVGNFLLTMGPDQVIVQGSFTPAFNVGDTGVYTIHPFVYGIGSPALVDLVFGTSTLAELNAELIQGGGTFCGSLDLVGAQVTVRRCLIDCDAEAGTLSADAAEFCFEGEHEISAFHQSQPTIPEGYMLGYVLSSGASRMLQAFSFVPSFTVGGANTYTIHTLVYDTVTFDPDTILFGGTTTAQLNAQFGQGGGTICAVLDLTGAVVQVLDCRPANDDCSNATAIGVGGPGGCDAVSVVGNNYHAVPTSVTSDGCANGEVADVWYLFNSGDNTEVSISLGPITMSNWGLAVMEECDGSVLACEVGPAAPIEVATVPNTYYKVQVFTDRAFGQGGEFVLCLTGANAAVPCDAGEVAAQDGLRYFDICKDGLPDPLELFATSTTTAAYDFVLTTSEGLLIAPFIGSLFDADTLALGSYRIHGVSYLGELLNPSPNVLVNDLAASGGCLDISSTFVVLNVELCSSLAPSMSNEVRLYPNPGNGTVTVDHDFDAPPLVEVFGPDGRPIHVQFSISSARTRLTIGENQALAHGVYLVRLSHRGQVHKQRLVITGH